MHRKLLCKQGRPPFRPEHPRAEPTLLPDKQRLFVKRRLLGRLAAVESIAYRRIVDSRQRHIDNPFVEIRLNGCLYIIKVPGIAVTFGIVYVLQAFKTARELLQILSFRLRPLHLGHSRQAWQKHIFGQVKLGYVGSPQIGLSTYYMLSKLRGQSLRHRLEAVYIFHRHKTSERVRLRLDIGRLEIVEIAVIRRRHHHVVSHLSSLEAALSASPRHHGGARCKAAFQNLVPAHYTAPITVEILLHSRSKVCLQLHLGS